MKPTLRSIGRMVTSTERLDAVPADADDNRIVECAVAAGSEVVISGDAHLRGDNWICRHRQLDLPLRGRPAGCASL